MFVLGQIAALASDHQVEFDQVSRFIIFALTDDNVFKVIFIHGIAAKRALLPAALLFKIEVLQYARPTVDMATLCYSRTDHFFQRFHANRTANIF